MGGNVTAIVGLGYSGIGYKLLVTVPEYQQ